MAQEDESPDNDGMDIHRLQYEKCIEHGNIIVGTRFSFFASFATIFFVLMGAYYYIWTSETGLIVPLKPIILFLTAIFGFMSASVAIITEMRNIQVIRTCYRQAAFIESKKLKIRGGIWQILMKPGIIRKFLYIPVSHTFGIMTFYVSVAIIWIFFAFSVFLF